MSKDAETVYSLQEKSIAPALSGVPRSAPLAEDSIDNFPKPPALLLMWLAMTGLSSKEFLLGFR